MGEEKTILWIFLQIKGGKEIIRTALTLCCGTKVTLINILAVESTTIIICNFNNLYQYTMNSMHVHLENVIAGKLEKKLTTIQAQYYSSFLFFSISWKSKEA